MHKVIFHVDEDDKLTMGINNIKNLLKAGVDVKVILLLNGEAPKAALSDERLSELMNQDVIVSVCNNSLRGLNIDHKDLLKGINIVPAGVLELIERQAEGYAYIRP